jgi:hypothetical protein
MYTRLSLSGRAANYILYSAMFRGRVLWVGKNVQRSLTSVSDSST